MLREKANILTIQGKAKKNAVKQIWPDVATDANQGWFFIDYAVNEVALNAKFDVLLEGESKQLISGPGSFSVKLLACLDQFGNKLSHIPEGYKTLCKLEFTPNIPAAIKKLPLLDQWDYNPLALSVADHRDIELATPDVVLNDLVGMVYVQMKSTFEGARINTFSKKDFVTRLESVYHTHAQNGDRILESLMQLGKVTRKSGDLLEFAESETY